MGNGRVAVVTGGSAGLGRAIVRELAGRGWDVAVLARGVDGLAGTVIDIEAAGSRALAIPTDVADRGAVENAAAEIERELGPIDLWVNNAMIGTLSEFLDTDEDDFERVTAVNYFGFVNGTRAALKRMVPRDRGHVLQIGSALSERGIPLQAAYCGSKHAIKGFTESVRVELLHDKSAVAISHVSMPALNTPQFGWVRSKMPRHPMPVAPIWQPEAAARIVADVAEKPRSRTWVGGSTFKTVLGNRVSGRFVDRYLARSGFDGQQSPDVPVSTMNHPNLNAPVAGDHGSRGEFGDQALDDSPVMWAQRNRGVLWAAGALAATAVAALGARAAK